MNAQRYKTAVGAFVLGGFVLFVAGLLLLSTRRFFSDDTEYVLYFDGSVSGLSIGAPVVFRGVPMGSVTHINLVADEQEQNVAIPVFIRIDEKTIMRNDSVAGVTENFEQAMVRRMVDRGMRARLQLQSFVTGKYCIELDFHPETTPLYRSATPELEIPTVPSPIDALQRALAKVPLEQILHSLDVVLSDLVLALSDGKLKQGIAAFADTFTQTQKLLQNGEVIKTANDALTQIDGAARIVREQTPEAMKAFREAMRALAETVAQLRHVADSAEALVRRDSPTVHDLRRLLQEGASAARSLRNLADMLEHNPEVLVRGRKP